MPDPRDYNIDVSHITGASTNGNYNDWTKWHSEVNKQTPTFLNGRYQPVKPSVSLGAGANVLLSPRLPADKSKPSGQPGAWSTATPPKDKDEDQTWIEQTTLWFFKEFGLPIFRTASENPLRFGLDYVTNPASTIIGKGNALRGTLEVLAVPKKIATSALINLGRSSQAVRQIVEGDQTPTDYWGDMQRAWDWGLQNQSQVQAVDKAGKPVFEDDGKTPVMVDLHDNLDIGTAWNYMVGQTAGVIPSALTTLDPEAVAKMDKFATDWGFVYSTSNFDVFSQEQRDLITGQKRDVNGQIIEGSGNGWTPGNVAVQTSNLIGDIALDPLSYVPFGNVGKAMFPGRQLLTNGTKEQIQKRVVEDASTMVAAAEGKSTVYDNFLNFAANNDASTISNHVVIRSITTGEKDRVAFLLGEVKNPADAAKVFLAVEYGSVRAQQELIRDYGTVSLAIDHINGGGYLNRAISEGKLAPENDLLEGRLHNIFYGELMKYADEINKSPFSAALRDTAYRINTTDLPKYTLTEFGVAPSMGALREITPVNIKWAAANRLLNQVEANGARVSTFFINGITSEGHLAVETPFKFGTKDWILHQIVRMGSTNAKGVIDVSNIDGIASKKFYGVLNDLDRLTKGALSMGRPKPGEVGATYNLKASFTDRWMRSTSALERAKIIEDLNQVGLGLIAKKHGAEDGVQKLVTEALSKKRLIFTTNLDSTGLNVMTQDGKKVIYSDPYAIGRGNTDIHMWDWNKVDTEFQRNNSLFKNLAYGSTEVVSNLYKELNGLFNALVVTRGSRFFRDIIANTATTLGSGYGLNMLSHLKPYEALKTALGKTTRTGDVLKQMVIRKGNLRDTVGAISKLEQEYDAIVTVVNGHYQKLVDDLATAPITAVNSREVADFLVAKQVLNRNVANHVSGIELDEVDPNRLLVSWRNYSDAHRSAIDRFTTRVDGALLSKAEIAGLPDDMGLRPKTVQELIDAFNSGERIHLRPANSNIGWFTLDVSNTKFNAEEFFGELFDKREWRIFGKDEFNITSMEQLKKLASDPKVKLRYAPSENEAYRPLTLDALSKMTEVPRFITEQLSDFTIYTPHIYGYKLDATLPFRLISKGFDDKEIRDLKVLIQKAEEFVASPTKYNEEYLLDLMRGWRYSAIVVRDATGKDVVISVPEYTVLKGPYGNPTRVINQTLDEAGFGFTNTKGVDEEALQNRTFGRQQGFEFIGDTPLSYTVDATKLDNIVPMPSGWTLISKPAEGYEPRLFIQIGGVSKKEYAVRIYWDNNSKYPLIKFIRPLTKKEQKALDDEVVQILRPGEPIENVPSKVRVPTSTWFRLQAEPAVVLGDFIKVNSLRKITSKSKESIDRVAEDQRLLESAANFGSFNPQAIGQISKYQDRLEEIERQLWHLHDNLSFVSGKLGKRDQQAFDDAQRKLALRGFTPVNRPPKKYDDPIMEELRIPTESYMGQMFGDALLGVNGSKWYSKVRNDSAEVRAQGTGFFTAGDNVVNKVFEPGDKGYWEAWQRTLNEHWRNADGSDLDPVIRIIIKEYTLGSSDEKVFNSVVRWMKETPAGQQYAKEVGVGPEFATFDHGIYRAPKTRFEQMDFEDYAEMQMANVFQHVGFISRRMESMDGSFESVNVIADKLLANEPITLEDLVRANLKTPSEFRTTEEVIINPETGAAELVPSGKEFRNLPSIWGTANDPIARRSVMEKGKYYLTQVNRVIADIPQEVLFQQPLFRAAYLRSLERQQTQMRIATGKDFFSQSEIMNMEEKARSFALTETRKWVYSTSTSRNIMTGIRQVVPFANASVFTAKWMANVVKERPIYVAWMVYEYNKAINGTQWYDRNGNMVSYDDKDDEGKPLAQYLKGNYPPGLINVLAGKPWDDPWAKNYVDNTFVSRTSVDPIWAGKNVSLFGVNVPNPFVNWGLSPAPAIAISELIKEAYKDPNGFFGTIGKWVKDLNDNAAGVGLDFLPFGVSPTEKSLGLLIPGQAAKMLVDDQQLLKLKLDAAIWLNGRYASGLGPKPTPELVDKVAGAWFDLQNSSSIYMPFATNYITGPDIARQTWQTYLQNEQEAYDELGAEEYTRRNAPGMRSFEQRIANLPGAKAYTLTPYDVARSKFLMEQPDLFFGAISQNSSDLRLTAQESTAKNLVKYKKLIPSLTTTTEGTDVASDILNSTSNSSTSPQPYQFSQDVYNILIERELIGKSTPEDVTRKTLIGKGNQIFRTGVDLNGDGVIKPEDGDLLGMNALDNLAFERNTPIEQDDYLSQEKQRLIKWISKQPKYGQIWADSRSNLNPQRYNNYAVAWDSVAGDITWQTGVEKENPTYYTAMTYYLERRKFYQNELRKRAELDPTQGTLSKNLDIKESLLNEVYYLKNYDTTGKFSEWYNNYFEGDTVN